MSFSSDVKQELNKLSNLANKEAVKYEFLGFLATNHAVIRKDKLVFLTENEYTINRFSKLLNNLEFTKHEIQIIGKTFEIKTQIPKLEEVIYDNGQIFLSHETIKKKILDEELLQKAFIRGAFLGGGSINNPKNNYHIEITLSNLENAKLILEILQKYQIVLKTIPKNKFFSIYAKDGEEISKFLAFIGASKSVLSFEEIRVYRDIRNNVNRKVNCETANLNKTVNSALKQIQAIEYLKKSGKLKELSEGIREVAELRIMHPEATLTELGNMLSKPIGKSGVNHRLNMIMKLAKDLK